MELTGTGTGTENFRLFKNVYPSSQNFTTANDHANTIGIPKGVPKKKVQSPQLRLFSRNRGVPLGVYKIGRRNPG